MLKLISKEDFNPEVMFPKLREKTYLFDYHTEESYTKKIMDGSFLIFVSEHLILPCEFIEYDTGLKVLEVNVVDPHGSNSGMEHVKDCLYNIEKYCKKMEIDRVVLRGRWGWIKVFPDYEVEQVVLIKEM